MHGPNHEQPVLAFAATNYLTIAAVGLSLWFLPLKRMSTTRLQWGMPQEVGIPHQVSESVSCFSMAGETRRRGRGCVPSDKYIFLTAVAIHVLQLPKVQNL